MKMDELFQSYYLHVAIDRFSSTGTAAREVMRDFISGQSTPEQTAKVIIKQFTYQIKG